MRGKFDEPVTVHTKLGWVLSGPMKGNKMDDNVRVNFVAQENACGDKRFGEAVQRLWDFETLGIREEDEVQTYLGRKVTVLFQVTIVLV